METMESGLKRVIESGRLSKEAKELALKALAAGWDSLTHAEGGTELYYSAQEICNSIYFDKLGRRRGISKKLAAHEAIERFINGREQGFWNSVLFATGLGRAE